MKVFYLSSSAFSDNQMSLLKHLGKKADITYAVIIPVKNSNYTKDELAAFCTENGIRFIPFELRHRFRDLRVMATYTRIINAIKKASPDVIYFANFDQLYLNALLLLLDQSKTIIALHDVESHSKTAFSSLVGLSKNLLIKRFRHFHTYSGIQQKILKTRVPEKAVYNISLPLIGFGDAARVPAPAGRTRFLFFGNILYYKGLDVLLRAFRNTAKNNPGATLTIAGRCGDWNESYQPLTEGITQIRADIRFIGNNEIPGYFANADYVVLPYRDTTQSGPLMIAYHYNVPVLVSKAEGFNEFTSEGNTGYSFNLYNEKDLEQVMQDCINRSAAEYEELKKREAAYTEENYSMPAIVKKYTNMFEATRSAN